MIKILVLHMAMLLPATAMACGCDKPELIDDLAPGAIVFIGEAVSQRVLPQSQTSWKKDGTPILNSGGEVITFKVIQPLRGETEDHIDVRVNGNTSCDLQRFTYSAGDKYVLSVQPFTGEVAANSGRAYWNSICDLRHRI